MEFLIVVTVLFAFPIILLGIYESDRIMMILKERYPDKWRESGYPCGYFKVQNRLGRKWWERDKIAMKLPFWWVKIDWIENDEEAKKRRKRIILIAPLVIIFAITWIATWWIEILPLFS